MSGISRITVEIGGKVAASLGQSLRAAQMQVSTFGRNTSRTMNDAAIAGRKGFKGMLDNALWQQAAAGAAGVGLALTASVRAAAKFEQSLTEISKTAQLGQTETKALGAEILKLTGRNETNQSAEQLAAGIKTLVGAGLSLQQAREAIRGIGRVATATGSDITEVANTSYQLMQNLNVSAGDVAKTFEVLAAAGKKGSFELKDMATYFPTIAAQAKLLGIGGVRGAASLAAMLQVVRRGAGDASTASNNLVNLLSKISSPDAVKNFKKFGVNIETVIKNAQAKGLNPLEESLKVIQKITNGDPFKISQLFGDMQVKNALIPLLKDFKDFERIRDESLKATGVVDEDYLKQIQTFSETLKSFRNSADRLGISLGNALLPSLTRMAEAITPLVEKFAAFAEKNPAIATGIVAIAGAISALVLIAPGVVAVASAIGTIAAALPIIAGLQTVFIVLGSTIGAAMLPLLPWIALIAGIGAAIYALIKYWPQISAAAGRAWAVIQSTALAAWGAITAAAGRVWDSIMGSGLGQMIEGIKTSLMGVVNFVQGIWNTIVGIFTLDPGKAVAGIAQAFAGLDQIGAGLVAQVMGLGRMVVGAFGAALSGIGALLIGAAQLIAAGVQAIANGIVAFIRGAAQLIIQIFRALPGLIIAGLQALVRGVQSIFNRIVSFIRDTPGKVADVGRRVIDAILNGLKARAVSLFGWVSSAWDRIKGMVSGGPDAPAEPAGPATGPTPSPGRSAPAPPPRARGGRVRAGIPYLVGERRPELFVPGMNGAIVPRIGRPVTAAAMAALLAAPAPAAAAPASHSVTIHAPVTIQGAAAGDPMEVRRQVLLAFAEIQSELESTYRVLLND